MKTIVKIDPNKEYDSAKKIIASLAHIVQEPSDLPDLDACVDNLKTVINVLMERASPKVEPPPKRKSSDKKKKKKRAEFDKLPSEKFPDLTVQEEIVASPVPPACPCCSQIMTESGLYKTGEKLDVVPKQYFITRTKRVVWNCRSCNGSMVNSPSPPSISKSSNYGDSLIIDAALSKYCDLIPMERYCAIAARAGVEGIPPNSLITATHAFASFLEPVFQAIKGEVLSGKVLLMDETPHKMLEGDETSNWYLWGFSTTVACIFEAHGTRSGDIPLTFLEHSKARYLVTDGYSGYKKAIKDLVLKGRSIDEVYCNAHAYRYFKEAFGTWKDEVEIFLEIYGSIYELERECRGSAGKESARRQMVPLFEKLKESCESLGASLMRGSSLEKAKNYFLNHFDGLTKCLIDIEIPLDNNFSERLLRSPVVGRKTWYGTHSRRGAQTSATLFSIVETCKINSVNPRNYFQWVTERIHTGEKILTPSQYKDIDSW